MSENTQILHSINKHKLVEIMWLKRKNPNTSISYNFLTPIIWKEGFKKCVDLRSYWIQQKHKDSMSNLPNWVVEMDDRQGNVNESKKHKRY